MPPSIVQTVLAELDALLPHIDALIILDQVEEEDCGIVTASLREALAHRAQEFPHVVFWADSRKRIHHFRNIIIKPNQFETLGKSFPDPDENIDDETLRQAVPQLSRKVNAPVCCTLEERGTLVSHPKLEHIPALEIHKPLDPTGAGDSVSASAVLALASGATLPEAALIGNLTASITIQQLATTGTATPQQLLQQLHLWHEQNL